MSPGRSQFARNVLLRPLEMQDQLDSTFSFPFVSVDCADKDSRLGNDKEHCSDWIDIRNFSFPSLLLYHYSRLPLAINLLPLIPISLSTATSL